MCPSSRSISGSEALMAPHHEVCAEYPRACVRPASRGARSHGGAAPGRLATLAFVERHFDAIPIAPEIAPHYGRLLAQTRRRRRARLAMADALIAATALAHRLPLITRDRYFARLDGVDAVI